MTTAIIKVWIFFLNIINSFIKCFKTKDKITFISRQSNSINADFKLIIESLKERIPECKIIVLCKKLEGGLFQKAMYFFHIFKQMWHIETSRMVILDSYCIPISVLKHKKNLVVLQIWHAIGVMKKSGYGVLDKKQDNKQELTDKRTSKIAELMKMHQNYDYILCSSENCKEALAEVFNYPISSFFVCPLPRVDLLRDKDLIEETQKKILKEYPLLKEKENIVYAPTYRDDEKDLNIKLVELAENIDFLKYNFIVKAHPKSKIVEMNNETIVDQRFTTLQMLSIADYVICDYSSVIYEAAIMKKPLYFFVFDFDEYSQTTDLYIDYKKEAPGVISENAKDIIKGIMNKEFDLNEVSAFLNKYVYLKEESCVSILVDFIKTKLDAVKGV